MGSLNATIKAKTMETIKTINGAIKMRNSVIISPHIVNSDDLLDHEHNLY
ncbi:hypothetical protein CQU01_10160 [Cerasibacillus quisquiliarum]|uniref:Uncharacterized protein n=1 Tax=Cerasibacillus quisquiliarum TaxID=227865 RepID=A0A511UYC9_9BACI|nr:hypothetical protein CQU01_10160 [Cerasibacillus quisquiliarum]